MKWLLLQKDIKILDFLALLRNPVHDVMYINSVYNYFWPTYQIFESESNVAGRMKSFPTPSLDEIKFRVSSITHSLLPI